MEKVLIIAVEEKKAILLANMIQSLDGFICEWVTSSQDAEQKFNVTDYDLTIINTPLEDDFGVKLTLYIAENSLSAILILVKSEMLEEIQEQVAITGAFAIQKPINKQLFLQSIPFVLNSQLIVKTLRTQNKKLKRKLEDIKYIERAKFSLIKYLGFDENKAHRYIQKQAMDRRISPREVADSILKAYEI